jgi:CspA family cold shock protein
MGRYKDYRETKRRGYDEGLHPPGSSSRKAADIPRPSALQAWEPVEAIVKWFNAEKGFGFIAVAGGSDAFMHIRQLEAAGHSTVLEGDSGQGPNWPRPEGP